MSRKFLIAILILLMKLNTSFADDASFGGDGATIFALKENRIRMLKENIVIKQTGQNSWRAECEFEFENQSNEIVDLQMGFPDWRMWGDGEDGGSPWAIKEFSVSIAGKALEPVHKEIDSGLPEQQRLEYSAAYTWPTHFAAKEKLVVKNSYVFQGLSTNGPFETCLTENDQAQTKDLFWRKAAKKPDGWDYEDSLCSVISYIVTTARTWSGPIGQADIKIERQDASSYLPHQIVLMPPTTQASSEWFSWHFTNWVPKSEIKVFYIHPPVPENSTSDVPLFDTTEQARAWLEYARKNNFEPELVEQVRDAMPIERAEIREVLSHYKTN